MKNKKGFTLVELLAVVVILAVIAIIAIPVTINIIETARKGALKDSVYGLVESANTYYFQNMKDADEGVQIEIINNEQVAPQEPKLSYKGKIQNGYVLIAYNGEVAICVDDGKYFASRALDSKEIIVDSGSCTSEFDDELNTFVTAGSASYVGLKLNVKAYNTKEALPAKGTEATIGIITDDKITGYYAGPTSPSEPKEGMVWVVTNNNAENFIITKTSKIGVSYALQYKDDKWELKDSYLYNNKWIQTNSYNDSEYEWNFTYDGKYKTFTAPYDGYYTVELWGAAGGTYSTTLVGGKGAYTKGDIYLKKDEELYIYVGGKGSQGSVIAGGWNGGGNGYGSAGYGGGGSTDVRTVKTSTLTTWNEQASLISRIMVAGGGSGAAYYDGSTWYSTGGDAGGLNSYLGTGGSNAAVYSGTIATQIVAGHGSASYGGSPGGFGYGGLGYQNWQSSGGGGGWYGGAGGSTSGGFASGGTSYISGHEGCISVDSSMYVNGGSLSNTGKYFLNTVMIDGKGYLWTNKVEEYTGMPTINDSKVKMTGNNDNGYARITFSNFDSLTEEKYEQISQSVQNVWEYDYMGYYQKFVAPKAGRYKFELWGAQGGIYSASITGGLGGYTSGEMLLKKGQTFYIYVGSQGGQGTGGGGWNGGGDAYGGTAYGGGGATDIRTVSTPTLTTWNNANSLLSRIMVAGGGGGATMYDTSSWYSSGGAAGGLNSYLGPGGSGAANYAGTIATQTTAGHGSASYGGSPGGFGYGGRGYQNWQSGGGGSGWYGGAGGSDSGGFNSGGSSYISGHNGCIGINGDGAMNASTAEKEEDSYSYTGYIFKNTKMIDGKGYEWTNQVGSSVVKMPSHTSNVKITGNTGNGFARITYISAS